MGGLNLTRREAVRLAAEKSALAAENARLAKHLQIGNSEPVRIQVAAAVELALADIYKGEIDAGNTKKGRDGNGGQLDRADEAEGAVLSEVSPFRAQYYQDLEDRYRPFLPAEGEKEPVEADEEDPYSEYDQF